MINLRHYQKDAVENVFEQWKEKSSTLIVAATGTGKTTTFTEIIRRNLPKRALILVHREELMKQARERLLDQAEIDCDIEMADLRASTSEFNRAPCVVATVQTLYSGNNGLGRMARFDPNDFGLLICDEAHHYVSPAYRKVIDYFRQNKDLKVLGVTATPDRTDEEALGQIFETVAHAYEILDAINDGWLVPVDQQMVHVQGLDFSGMRTTAGDLNGADLAAIMEKEEILQGVASSSIKIIGDKRTIAFTSSVKHAEMLSDIFNRHRFGMSDWICGKTNKKERAEKLEMFKEGKTQVMVNCGVLTEGFDCPEVEVIIQARPTKSRCLYAQIIGRSLRPLPGIIDHLEMKEARRLAIKRSVKPSALIIDFVGNAGRHKLMSSADILGGNVSDEAIERAIDFAKKTGKPLRMNDALGECETMIKAELDEKRQKEIARKHKLVAEARYLTTKINPFDAFQLDFVKERGWDSGKTYSEKQRMFLLKIGINPDEMGYANGVRLIAEQCRRYREKLCTSKQAALLQKHGYETRELKMADASKLIDALAKNGWRRPVETNI